MWGQKGRAGGRRGGPGSRGPQPAVGVGFPWREVRGPQDGRSESDGCMFPLYGFLSPNR